MVGGFPFGEKRGGWGLREAKAGMKEGRRKEWIFYCFLF